MGARLSQRRVVLAVRDPALFRSLVRALELEGARVLPAGDGEGLLRLLDTGLPEICLVDADLDGLDLSVLRTNIESGSPHVMRTGGPAFHQRLVLLLSADPVAALEGTLDGFPVLAVPFDRKTLIDRIESLAGGG